MEFAFGPGEEKLAKAYELIAALQQQLVRVTQRGEIDALITGVLLAQASEPATTSAIWQAVTAQYYPAKAVAQLGSPVSSEGAMTELKDRIAFWTRVIESRLQSEG